MKVCIRCALACLALYLSGPSRVGAAGDSDGSGINWLPLAQSSPPSKIAELRRDILTFIEPLRRELLGDPGTATATAFFISVPTSANPRDFPSATSTNADGTLACVLSAAQFLTNYQRIQTVEGVELMAAPRAATLERVRATLSVSRAVQIGATNAAYGQTVDVVHRIQGTNLHMRVIADATQAMTNVVPATASAPATEAVSIKTLFQSALEARVPAGGAVAIWRKPTGEEKGHLLLISPAIGVQMFPLPWRRAAP